MGNRWRKIGILMAGYALGIGLPSYAAVSDEEFKALKELVTKQGQRIDELERAREQDKTALNQSQKVHEQDQQEIERLKQRLDETQKSATATQQKVESIPQMQPVHPIPEGSSATHNFMVVGDAEVQFGKTEGSHAAFVLADFAPIFLFRARDNILFEAGFDVRLQNGSAGTHDSGSETTVDLSFATLDYLFNDYVTLVAGDMLLPLGTYSERSAGWLNKIPDDPLPRSLLPGSGIGLQLRGSIPVGVSGQSIAYSAYGVNGPSSMNGTGNHDQLDLGGNVGIKGDNTFGNLHGAPSGGARVGWFYPWKAHHDLELGVSGQAGPWDDSGNRLWSSFVLDGALHLSSYIEVKGEYINSWVQTDDLGTIHQHGLWVQGAYKLAGLKLESPLVNNLEFVGRYDTLHDGFSTRANRYTIGYIYYITNTLLFEGDYEFASSNNDLLNHNRLVFQLSFGF